MLRRAERRGVGSLPRRHPPETRADKAVASGPVSTPGARTRSIRPIRRIIVGVAVATAVTLTLGACGGDGDLRSADVALDDVEESLRAQGIDCDVLKGEAAEAEAERRWGDLTEYGGPIPAQLLDCGTSGFEGARWDTHDQLIASKDASVASLCASGITEVPEDLSTITLAGDRTIVVVPHAQGFAAVALTEDTGLEQIDVEVDCD